MLDITADNFETEVVLGSQTTPVLLDFWAPWCGPCKSLSPVLEKLEAAYGGRFVLAKVNSDEQQELAAAFGIRSIPTCILMIGGRPVDGSTSICPAKTSWPPRPKPRKRMRRWKPATSTARWPVWPRPTKPTPRTTRCVTTTPSC
jgi:thioredoxin